MRESGEALVASLGITKGMKVLDLGCGDGTTALPEANLGADVLGVDIAAIWSRPATGAPAEHGPRQLRFQEGDADRPQGPGGQSFDLVVSIFGAMFAPRPFDVAKEMVRVTKPGGRIVMGNWIPGDPTLVAQILKISAAYTPPPPEGFISPMTWGVEDNVIERFGAAGIADGEDLLPARHLCVQLCRPPADFVEAFRDLLRPDHERLRGGGKDGRAGELQGELEALFEARTRAATPTAASFPRPCCGSMWRWIEGVLR